MPIKRVDIETGEIITLTDREIKKEIQSLTGWTNAEYQRKYDIFRNRLRNYESIIGQKSAGRANEELLRLTRKQNTGELLTAKQQAILKTTSASTLQFLYKARENRITKQQQAVGRLGLIGTTEFDISSIEGGEFSGLINKSETTRNNLINYLNEVVGTEKKLINGEWQEEPIRRRDNITASELKRFLAQQAKELHQRQRRTYESNRAYYASGREVGSD